MSCSHKRNLLPSPVDFLNEIIPKVPRNIRDIIEKLKHKKNLSYRDAFIIIYQLLPPATFNEWPDVQMQTPLKFPETHSFNLSFSKEWYYMNVNGITETGDRFYILRFLKRTGTVYKQGLEGGIWLLADASTCTIVDPKGNVQTFREGYVYPCTSVATIAASADIYYIQEYPFKVSRGNAPPLIELNPEGNIMNMDFNYNTFTYHISAKCTKPILLQGKNLNGLDPGADQFISKITGTSYLYYSWPSWELNDTSYILKDNHRWVMDKTKDWNLWLDHQGGNVKDPKQRLIAQLALMAALRPNAFPGWNWFSIQLFDNTQFTGFSNKPWKNNTSYNHQQLQGTWDDSEGKLTWITGSIIILKFWKSPDSGINFGIEYSFNLGKHGTYYLKSIAPDQRVLVEGIENYEGGVDVYSNREMTKKIGYGNIECVGWPSAPEKVDYALKSMGADNLLTKKEKNKIADSLTLSMAGLIAYVVIFFVLILGLLCFAFHFIFKNKLKKRNQYLILGLAFLTSGIITVGAFIVLYVIIKVVSCSVARTCAVGRMNGCLFNCPS